MKKYILSCFLFTLLFSVAASLCSAKDIRLIIEGHELETDNPPIIMYDRVMLPVRTIFEGVGAELAWNGETKTLTGTKGRHIVVMTVGEEEFTIDGQKHIMSTPPLIIDGRTFASARYVAESFGYVVNWDKDELIVRIESEEEDQEETKVVETKTEVKKEETKAEVTKAEVKKEETKAEVKKEENTKKEPDTEETTKAKNLVSNVTPALFSRIKSDLLTAFDGYALGIANDINRFKIATVKYYKDSWTGAAKTSEDKTYVGYCKTLYDRVVNTAKRIDNVYKREKYVGKRDVADDCMANKEMLEEYITSFFSCETFEDCKATLDELNDFYAGIKTRYSEYE